MSGGSGVGLRCPRIYSAEDVKRALKAILAGPEMSEALRRVVLEQADGIDLPPFAEVHTTAMTELSATPALELISFPSKRDEYEKLDHHIVIVITVQDNDEERLDGLVSRYITAVEYALIGIRDGSLLPYVPHSIRLGRVDYEPPDRNKDGDPISQVAIIEAFCRSLA